MGAFGPSSISGYWPSYRHEWADLLAQAGSDLEIQQWRAEQSNKIRMLPSANEISRMEQAIYWPAQFLKARPIILRIVQTVALYRARDLDIEKIAHCMRKTSWRVHHLNRQGLDEIASGLRRGKVPVF